MITLYAYHPAFGLPSSSPFVVKTMIDLAMVGKSYEIEPTQDPSTAPKGKLPYIRDGDMPVADSELIRKHLEQRYGVDCTPARRLRRKLMGGHSPALSRITSIGVRCMITGRSRSIGQRSSRCSSATCRRIRGT